MLPKIIQRNSSFILLLLIIISVWYYWFIYNKNVTKTAPHFKPLGFNDKDECYKSYAFQNDLALKYQLKTIFDIEDLLQQENKRKIFFHQTDCIHNGVLHITAR